MQSGCFQSEEVSLAKNPQGLAENFQQVILILKLLQTKP